MPTSAASSVCSVHLFRPIGTGLAAPLGAASGAADVARHSESRVRQRRNRWLLLHAISAPAQAAPSLSQLLVGPPA
eukprot:8010464-Pyramimonas_sp.AAC.1